MKIIDVHPEHLIEGGRTGTLDASARVRLARHRTECVTCAIEHVLEGDFELDPDEADRARAARIVASMFGGEPRVMSDPARHTPDEAPRRAGPRHGGAFGLAASLVAHALLLVAVLSLPQPVVHIAELSIDPISFDPIDPTDVGIPAPSETPSTIARAIETVEPGARSFRPRRGAVLAASSMVVIDRPAGIERDEIPVVSRVPDLDPAGLRELLDPGRVARASVVLEGAPSERGLPAGLGHAGARSVRDIEWSLSAGLRAEAMTKAHTERTSPRLQRRTDGSHVYAGPRFTAIVRPDGSVEFQDRSGVPTEGFSASGTFDLSEAIMGASGQDPLRAERDWFMRHTEELRHRLEAEDRRRMAASALVRLRGRLARVWATTERSPSARRRRIFSIWDDMAEDHTGRDARRVVIEFVREALAPGTQDAYSEGELRSLNAARESREPFAP